MRTKRFTITAFLLCAVMLLGVGFAELTDVLDLNGFTSISKSAAQETFINDVYFSDDVSFSLAGSVAHTSYNNAEKPNTAQLDTTNDPSKDKITFYIRSFADVGDSATITCTVLNEFKQDVDLVAVITNDQASYFSVETNWVDNMNTVAAKTGDNLGECELQVKITCLSLPTGNAEFLEAAIGVSITATAD